MDRFSKWHLFFIVLFIGIVFSAIGYYLYKTESIEIRKEKYAYLDAIANLKVDQLTKWKTERLSEAKFFPTMGKFIKSTITLSSDINNKESKDFLTQTLLPIKERHSYQNLFVTDLNGKVLFTLDPDVDKIDSITFINLKQAVTKDSIIFMDFYQCNTHHAIHLDILSPIKDNNNNAIGVFILRFDPNVYLYPLIQKWPTPSKTAESLIFRNEGKQIRLLSKAKHVQTSAMDIIIPIENKEYVAVKGAHGQTGIMEGLDYRGVQVLAAIHKVPTTNWYLVSKVDTDEIFNELVYRGRSIVLLTMFSFLLVAAMASFLYKRRQSAVYKNLFLKEKELSETKEEYRTALYSIGDAVIATDRHSIVKQMNSVAEELTGWKESEAKGKKLDEVFRIINEETKQQVQNPVKRVLKEGTVIGLANHTLLISKDGKEIPIADSGSPIKNDENQIIGVILVFRDQTEERTNEKILFESNDKFSKIFQHSSDSISLTELSTGKLFEVNGGFEKMFGYSREEVLGRTTFELNLWSNQNDRTEIINQLKQKGQVRNFEAIGSKKDGTQITALISGEILTHNNIQFILFTIKDITEQKIFEESLKASEEKYKMLLEFASDAFFQGDGEGNFITVNDQAVNLTGYQKDELLKMNMKNIFTKDVLDNNPLRYDRLMNGETIKNERYIIKKDGSLISVEMTSKRMPDGTYQSFFRDITNRKIIERELKDSEEKFRKAFITSPDSININRLSDGRYVSINSGFTKVTGYTEEEVIGKTSAEIQIWADVSYRNVLVEKLKSSNLVENFEAKFRIKDGRLFDGLMSAAVIELNSEPHIISITRDISDRKKADELIKSSEANLNALINNSKESIWSIDKDYNYIVFNNFFAEAYFASFNQKLVKGINALNILTPELKAFWKPKYDAALSGKKNEFEFSMDIGNEINYYQVFLNPIISDDIITGVSALSVCITELKKIEQMQRLSETNLKNSQRVAKVGHYDFNVNAGTWSSSEMLDTIFGIDQSYSHNVEGWSKLIYPDDREMMMSHLLDDVVKDRNEFNKEYRIIRHSDKEVRWMHGLGKIEADEKNDAIHMFGTIQDITERKKVEEEVNKTKIHFQKLIENAPDGIVQITIDGKFKYVSPSAKRIFGHPIDQRVEQSPNDLTHPDDLPRVLETLNKIIQNPTIIPTIEYRFKHTNGEYIWIESTFNNLLNEPSVEAIIINFRDISYRKKAEEKLRTLSRAVEQSPAIMVITDKNGNIEYVNPKFTDVTGYTFEEAIGKNPRILKSGHTTQQEYKNLWEMISEKNEWSGEFFNRKKNGELYWESAYISPILNEFGEITNYIALKEDITERKSLLADLIEAKEKAEEMNRVKAYFFANMSHELRTPFVGIVGFSELLSESLQNPEEKEMANQILKSSKRLTETLNKILNVTRLEFDKLEVKLRDIDVIEMIDQLKILFSKSASSKNISIKTKISQDEIVVKTDGRMLDEMITNLLNNAIKYTQDGFIDISAETIVRENKNYLLLKVADTGVGIPKNKQEIIWKEFRQVSEGMNRSFEGTGLGLTIIKKYVETLSGKITLESEIGKGSTFVIEIPVEIVSKKEVNKSKEIVLKQTQNNIEIKSRKPKILYVEDDVIALSYVDKVLKAFYEIDTAFNATIALELANKNIYEAMLLDINLGKGIDGVELMQMMRKINGYNKIPIVAVTAYAAESDRLEFLAKGFTHYLSKPFTSVELRGMLGKIFNS